MKADWTETTLGQACSIARGGSPRPIQAFLTDDADGINWVKISDATASGKYIYETAEKIKPAGATRSRVVHDGDFLLSNSMSFGRPYIMRITGCIHDGWLVLSKYQDSFDQTFLYHLLGSPQVFSQFDRLAAGSTVRNLNIELASQVVVPVPPLPEQQRIVAILDEAFEGIATAKAKAEKNLQNARELFEAYLRIKFDPHGEGWKKTTLSDATGGVFTGPFGSLLHKSDYVENGIPLVNPAHITDVGIEPDFRKSVSKATAQRLSNYVLREGDVVIGRRGEMGRCAVVTDAEDGWLCGTGSFTIRSASHCDARFLVRLLRSESCKKRLEAIAGGAVMPNLSNTDLGNFEILLPPLEVQREVLEAVETMAVEIQRIEAIYQRKLAALDELKKSLLHQAFTGQLTATQQASVVLQSVPPTTTPEFAANVIALAQVRHERQRREKTFGHVKEQKLLHLVESIGKIDLGRQPMRDAAGPNDFQHMLKAEEWARAHHFFEMAKRGEGYEFRKLSAFDEHLSKARRALGPYLQPLERVIDLLVPMDTEEAEVFATVHAAWNNLLIDGADVTDAAIVSAAREGWHPDKLRIPVHKFQRAMELIRQQGLVPDGTAKYVGGQQRLL